MQLFFVVKDANMSLKNRIFRQCLLLSKIDSLIRILFFLFGHWSEDKVTDIFELNSVEKWDLKSQSAWKKNIFVSFRTYNDLRLNIFFSIFWL